MKDPSLGREGQAGAPDGVTGGLYQLHQRANQFAQALELSVAQEREGGPLFAAQVAGREGWAR